jgi:hypothetical protein
VVDRLPRKLSYLTSVQCLERGEAADIKGLEEMRRVGWHTQRDDLVVGTELIKVWCYVASMTVKYKQSPCSDSIRLYMSVEVTYLLNTKLICCLSIVTDSDSSV